MDHFILILIVMLALSIVNVSKIIKIQSKRIKNLLETLEFTVDSVAIQKEVLANFKRRLEELERK